MEHTTDNSLQIGGCQIHKASEIEESSVGRPMTLAPAKANPRCPSQSLRKAGPALMPVT